MATICPAKFWHKIRGRSYRLGDSFTGLPSTQRKSPERAREQAFAFQRRDKPRLKVKAGSSVGGSCERAATGSCARESIWEGNSGTAVSDNSFSVELKHMQSHSGMKSETKTRSHEHKHTQGGREMLKWSLPPVKMVTQVSGSGDEPVQAASGNRTVFLHLNVPNIILIKCNNGLTLL